MRSTAYARVRMAVALTCSVWVGCGGVENDDRRGFSAVEWAIIATLSPLPPPPAPEGIRPDRLADATALGQRIFFDRGYSGALEVGDTGANGGLGAVGETGKVACADCHVPEAFFRDDRSRPSNTSLGANWTRRNAPTLVNAVYYDELTWDGNYSTMADLILFPLESPRAMNSTALALAQHVEREYLGEYVRVFGPFVLPDDAAEVTANVGRAIGAYQRLLVSGDSAFDRWVAGDDAAMTEAQLRGLELFLGKGLCVECHSGPTLSDGKFHNLGVGQEGAFVPVTDLGRAEVTEEAVDEGKFRTPQLRNVARTAPYMHNGTLATLTEVVEFYNWGGDADGFAGTKHPFVQELGLTAAEVDDLVRFLKALDGEPIADELLR